jgi:HK97 family phage major capsid protein
MMADDIKEAVTGLMTAFEEFKSTNDARLKEVEKKGAADPLLDDKLARINGKLDQFEGLNAKLTKAEADAKAAKDSLDAIETKLNRPGFGGGKEPEVADLERKAFVNFVRKGADRMGADEIKVLRVSDDTAGGYLAPTEFVREIIKAEVEFSPMRPMVRVRQTGQKSAQIPRRTGTFTAQWVSEIQTRTETTGLTYGLHEVPTHEMTAEVYISFAELEDSAFNMEAEISAEMAEQFGVAEGLSIVSGNGIGKPFGFMSDSNVGTTNSGAAATVTADGYLSLFYAIKTAYARNASFVMNRATLGSTRKLKDGNGQYLWMPGLASGVPNTINGAPYTEVPDMPSEGAGLKPVAFGDWRRGYILIDRINMTMMRDPYTLASVGQVKFVARRRLGGQVLLAEALRTMTCSA